jgi:hypothetical protein
MKIKPSSERVVLCSLLIFLLAGGGGCQSERVDKGPEIVLKIPVTLFRNKELWEEFLSRATHLELIITSREGKVWRRAYPAQDWSNLKIPESAFAVAEGGPYRFEVNLWDRKKNGYLRETPALSGSREIRDEEWGKVIQSLVIRLSLFVSLDEYQKT